MFINYLGFFICYTLGLHIFACSISNTVWFGLALVLFCHFAFRMERACAISSRATKVLLTCNPSQTRQTDDWER